MTEEEICDGCLWDGLQSDAKELGLPCDQCVNGSNYELYEGES